MIYVILGMHKSGTTLVSQILHHSGINMGEIDPNVHYDRGNKYERQSCLKLNLDILGTDTFHIIDLAASDALQLTEEQRRRMREIIQSCNKLYADWGFKDPRTSLTYPLWASELPEHKIIAVYRLPAEIWPRFRHQNLYSQYRNPYRAWEFMQRWHEHNLKILNYLQQTKMDFLVMSYHELMASRTEFERLQEFVGVKLNDRREKGLYRHQAKKIMLLEIVDWLMDKQTGYTSKKIIEQFESLRHNRVPASEMITSKVSPG